MANDKLPEFEISNEINSSAENINKVITIAGSPLTVSRTDGKDIQLALVSNPLKGTRGNDFADVLYVTIDGQTPSTKGFTLMIGEKIYFSGIFTSLKIDANNNNTNAEIILWG